MSQEDEPTEIKPSLRIRGLNTPYIRDGTAIIVELLEGDKVIYRVLLDAGIQQSRFENIKQVMDDKVSGYNNGIQSVFISHLHQDHIRCLPLIYKYWKRNKNRMSMPKIYISSISKNLLPVVLNFFYRTYTKHLDDEELILDRGEINEILPKMTTVSYYETHIIEDLPERYTIKVRFLPSGHQTGSAMIEFGIYYADDELGRILFTGDFCIREGSFLVEHADLRYVAKSHYTALIFENTRLFKMRDEKLKRIDIKRELVNRLSETLEKGGNVVLTVSGIDETANLLVALREIYEDNELGRNFVGIPIYLDTFLGIETTTVYQDTIEKFERSIECPGMREFFRKELVEREERGISITNLSNKSLFYQCVLSRGKRECIIEKFENGQVIIIASKANFKGGTFPYYLEVWGYNPNNLFFSTDLNPDALPKRLSYPKRDENGKVLHVEMNRPDTAKVDGFDLLSAHATYSELKHLVNTVRAEYYLGMHVGNMGKNPPSISFIKDSLEELVYGGKFAHRDNVFVIEKDKPITIDLRPYHKRVVLDKSVFDRIERLGERWNIKEMSDKNINKIINRLISEYEKGK